jgi:hypothetical protein
MAKIEVTGDVQRLLGDKGFTLAEPIRKQNGVNWEVVGSRYYTVWVNQLPQPSVSGAVTVSGNLSWKLEEYEGKQQMKVYVNATQIRPALDHVAVVRAQNEFAKIVQESAPSVAPDDIDLPF